MNDEPQHPSSQWGAQLRYGGFPGHGALRCIKGGGTLTTSTPTQPESWRALALGGERPSTPQFTYPILIYLTQGVVVVPGTWLRQVVPFLPPPRPVVRSSSTTQGYNITKYMYGIVMHHKYAHMHTCCSYIHTYIMTSPIVVEGCPSMVGLFTNQQQLVGEYPPISQQPPTIGELL